MERKDVFGRTLMIGDIIICFPHDKGKNICIKEVSGFFGKDGYEVDNGFYKLKSECLILKRLDGTKYFDSENLPLNCWSTSGQDDYILS